MLATFLRRIWPPGSGQHFICVAKNNTVKNYSATTPEDTASLLQSRADTSDVYFSSANYADTARTRHASQVLSSRTFYLDIDPGKHGAAATVKECLANLIGTVHQACLPSPTFIVLSGHGLHAYWVCEDAVARDQWRLTATKLQTVVTAVNLGADPSVTTDIVRILRPPGTINHKHGKRRQVRLLYHNDAPLTSQTFIASLDAALQHFHVKPPAVNAKATNLTNEDLTSFGSSYQASSQLIAGGCAQLRHMRDTQGVMPEPLWHACLGVLRLCEDGERYAHEWSQGDPRYDPAQVNARLERLKDIGPTTCEKFRSLDPAPCQACPHKIKSPIQLGLIIHELPKRDNIICSNDEVVQLDKEPPVPRGYRLTSEGVVLTDGDVMVPICDHAIRPVRVLRTDTGAHAYEFLAEHSLAKPRLITIEHAELPTDIDIDRCLYKHGIICNKRHLGKVNDFFRTYISSISRQVEAAQSYRQNGWTDEGLFVAGNIVYLPNGETRYIKESALPAIKAVGSYQQWQDIMTVYDRPGFEQYQFAIACAFASPLMRLIGYEGILVSMMSPTGGEGKTTALQASDSVFGDARGLQIGSADTNNVILRRMARHGSLAINCDEFSNRSGSDISNLVYAITQGREKRRLHSNGDEHESSGNWNLIGCASTNQSLLYKLAQDKGNVHAEAYRIFEYVVANPYQTDPDTGEVIAGIAPHEAADVFPLLTQHYGHAGPLYARYLVQSRDAITVYLRDMAKQLNKQLVFSARERFWNATLASVSTGLTIANHVGILHWDHDRLMTWAKEQVQVMRRKVNDLSPTASQILAAFLNQHLENRIYVSKIGERIISENEHRPRGQIVSRLETWSNSLFIDLLYLRQWLGTKSYDVNWFLQALTTSGLLRNKVTKQLAEHTEWSSAVTTCIELDTTHELLQTTPPEQRGRPNLTLIQGTRG